MLEKWLISRETFMWGDSQLQTTYDSIFWGRVSHKIPQIWNLCVSLGQLASKCQNRCDLLPIILLGWDVTYLCVIYCNFNVHSSPFPACWPTPYSYAALSMWRSTSLFMIVVLLCFLYFVYFPSWIILL